MSLTLYFFFGFVAILLLALGWALRPPRKRRKLEADPRSLEELGQRRVTYLPQIRQASVALAKLFQRARIGLKFPSLPRRPQRPAERKEQDRDEAEEEIQRETHCRFPCAFQIWQSCSFSNRNRRLICGAIV